MPTLAHPRTDVNAPWVQHVCPTGTPRHPEAFDLAGHAIDQIWHEGRWWAGNGEYATAITFCPFCGERLPEP